MKLLRLCLVPLALVCVAILRLLRGRVRLGLMQSNRLGHLAGNTEVYLCERDAGVRAKSFDIWGAMPTANRVLLSMWHRALFLDPTGFSEIVRKVNQLFPGHERYEVESGNLDRDVNNLLEKQPPHLYFTHSEQRKGEQTLRGWGLPEGAKFVCLIVRDAAYLPQLGYHSYRDSDIDAYLPACAALAERGYYVFRMGAKVAKPMAFYTDRIIDYATNGMRSAFMDVWLGAHCEFCVSNGCGFDAIPVIFRRPVCYVNYAPLEYLPTFNPRSLAIWKHHEKEGKRMTPAEIYESGAGQFMRAGEFVEAGIKLVDNTPEEIRAVVEEMADRIDNPFSFVLANTHDTQPERFWQSFPRSVSPYTQRPLHGEIRMRIGAEFLKGYQ